MFLKRVLIAILICSQASYAGVAELVTNIGASAEYIAVGGNDSVSYGAHSVFNNPTQIADNDSFSVSLFTTTIMQDVNYRNAAISKQWGRFSAGVGYMDATVEDIPETLEIEDDEIGISSYYSAQAKAIKGAFSYKASEQFSIGMLINHYHNQVHNVIGSATNTDIGFSYKQYNLLFTGTIKNIYQNKKMEYSNKAIEELPLSTTLSAHLYYAYIQPMAQISISNHGLQGYSIGSIISHPSFSYLDVLVGFKSAYHLAGFRHRMTLGFGLNMNNMSVNFTYEKSNSVAFDHNTYFSMNYNF